MAKKEVYVKTYDVNGNIKGFFYDFQFNGFKKSINSGLGQLIVSVPRQFDDFGEGTEIDQGYELRVYIADQEAPNGLQVFSGFIGKINAIATSRELVSLVAYGYLAKLGLDVLKDGTNTSIKYREADYADISDIFEDIIDKYTAVNTSSPINYTVSSVASGGKQVAVDFVNSTYEEALSEVRRLSDSDYYYYLDETNVFNFNQISSIADHLFIFEKDVIRIENKKSLLDMRNGLLFWNGQQEGDPDFIYKFFEDTASISTYGRQIGQRRDGRFANSASVEEWGSRYLAANKDPINSLTMRIIDSNLANGYDIESIDPGDTCKVLNISTNSALTDNMLITSVDYRIDYVEIEVADVTSYLDRNIFELGKFINDRTYSDSGPINYTT